MSFEIAQAYPALAMLPYVELASLPTPVVPLDGLGQRLGLDRLYCKRDDLSGQDYGGNKVRKLEFLFGEALSQGHKGVMTIGAIGSNHVLATSIYARKLGLTPMAQHYPQPLNAHVTKNLKALSTTKPVLKLLGHPAQLPFSMFKEHLKHWIAQQESVYYIPAGGSSALGAVGYVNAAFELKRQIERGESPVPDEIFITAGTCGTVAGLALGLKMAGLEQTHIRAVRVVDRVVCNMPNITRLMHQTKQLLESYGASGLPAVDTSKVSLVQGYFGQGYGIPTAEGEHATLLNQECASPISLDPTYTAKTMSALIGLRQELNLRDKVVFFWHTLSAADLSQRLQDATPALDLPPAYLDFLGA